MFFSAHFEDGSLWLKIASLWDQGPFGTAILS